MVSLQDVFTLSIALSEPLEIGRTPSGFRRVIPIAGGSFRGPAARGRVLAGGADWNVVRPDGTAHLWARYTLETEDGVLIMVTNEGLRPQDAAMRECFARGQTPDPGSWYCRTTPVFEVADGEYGWLNRSVFVGDMRPRTTAGEVVIDVHRVS